MTIISLHLIWDYFPSTDSNSCGFWNVKTTSREKWPHFELPKSESWAFIAPKIEIASRNGKKMENDEVKKLTTRQKIIENKKWKVNSKAGAFSKRFPWSNKIFISSEWGFLKRAEIDFTPPIINALYNEVY